jgi:2-hydroxy-3-oxopropionate reductase
LHESEPRTIGLIGLGVMGLPMGRNLLAGGYNVVAYDRDDTKVRLLVEKGARAGTSVRQTAADTDLLITMLPDSPDVQSVYLGPDGAFDAIRPGWMAIDMSTIAPRVARELSTLAARSGATMLDAPVSGGDKGATAGTLSIMVGGTEEGFRKAHPVLSKLGSTIVHVGPPGAGQVVKACNQVVVGVVIEAVAEALVLGSKAGVDPRDIVRVLQGGLAATRVLELRGENMLGGSFDPGFRIDLHLKDLRLALELARDAGVCMPLTAQTEQLMQAARIAGRGDRDHSALLTVVEDLAAYRVRDYTGGARV